MSAAGFAIGSNPRRVILLGVAIGIPMFLLQAYGSGFLTLLIPLAIMTMGFGFTNVGATTFALQSANPGAKELALGISRASTSFGQAIGPLVCGALIQGMGYEGGFQAMALSSTIVLALTWVGLKRQPAEKRLSFKVQGSRFNDWRFDPQP